MSRSDQEEQDQIALVYWVSLQHPKLFKWLHHSPNGGYRGNQQQAKRTGAKFKAMGTKAGFLDLVGYFPRGEWQGIVIEMKRPASDGRRKGETSKPQLEWLNHFASIGYYTCVCYGFDSAKDMVDHYMSFEVIET